MSLLFPIGIAALGAIVPLVLLYLLKQKRVEVKVPTNFLWARAVEDLRASSLFQRLRATLLLLLQAAAVVLFALAAAGASLELRLGDTPRHVIVLIDRSASMKCVDEEGGRSRFDLAKEIAQRQAKSLTGADEMMVIAFDVRAEVVAAFTSEESRLTSAIEALVARDLPTRAAEPLMLAVSFAQASKGFDAEIQVLSDGVVDDDIPPIPYPITFVRLGKSDANQGITSVQIARVQGEATQVFVRVENGARAAAQRNVTLRRGGETIDARAVELPAEGGATAFFQIPETDDKAPVLFTASLEGKDVLAADDAVTFVLRPSVPRNGLLVTTAPALYLDPKKLERLHPGLALIAVSEDEARAVFSKSDHAIDFVCFDGVEPKELPPVAAQLYVDALPPGGGLVRGPKQEYPIVVDWDRTHPTTTRCQFDDLLVTESTKLGGTERSRVLIDSTGGPLALLTPVPGREVVVLAFSPAQSNFPLKLSWPLFLANTLDFLLGKTERAGEEPVLPTGAPLAIGRVAKAHVTAPSGATADVPPDARGHATYTATNEAGVYLIAADDGPDLPRAFALLDGAESRVAPREKLGDGADALPASARPTERNVLLRDPLLLAALGILVLEWAIWCGRR